MSIDKPHGVKLPVIIFTFFLFASFIKPAIGLPFQSADEAWVQYQDPYWEFRVAYPAGWTLQPVPYRDFGFRISSPTSHLDPLGRLITGAYFAAQVEAITAEEYAAYRTERLLSPGIQRHTYMEVSGKPAEELTIAEDNGINAVELLVYADGFLRVFRIATTSQADQAAAERILTGLELTGMLPREHPYISPGDSLASPQFQFPVLLHAFQAGAGRILFDYGLPTHTGGDDFAFDICEGASCMQGSTSQYILAPTDITLVYSGPGYGMPSDSQDYHIFEITDDGAQKLCLSLGHFQIMLPGLLVGKRVPQRAAIGQLSAYTSIPHIHIGLWLSPSIDGCDGFSRLALPFSGAYKLDGVDYPAGNSYAGLSVTSHNIPVCAAPAVNSPGSVGGSQVLISPGDCFPPCPQTGGVILYKNAVYACNAEGLEAGYGRTARTWIETGSRRCWRNLSGRKADFTSHKYL